MDKKYLVPLAAYLVVVIIVTVALYLVGTFVAWNTDVSVWSKGLRFVIGIAGLYAFWQLTTLLLDDLSDA